MELSKETLLLLEDIERRIDPETEEDLEKQWLDFTYGRFEGEIFCPNRKKLSVPSVEPPFININDAIKDYDLMLRGQLAGVSGALNGTHNTLCIRANYGTGIMTSLFGAEIFIMPYENNTLPTTRPFNDTERIRRTVGQGLPDVMNGFGKNVFEFGEFCAEIFEKYPKIKKYVNVYHPDTQGPLDICELLWGCDMFYALYDEPDLAHAMLSLITDAYIAVMDKWYDIFPKNTVLNHHWGGLCHRGALVLRSDSAMNISPEIYKEYSAPYDQKLLNYYGGGVVHFCGRGDHYIEILSELNGLYGINMSQPECNDMEKIYRNTVDKGIKILCFNHSRANEDKCRQGGFNGCLSV